MGMGLGQTCAPRRTSAIGMASMAAFSPCENRVPLFLGQAVIIRTVPREISMKVLLQVVLPLLQPTMQFKRILLLSGTTCCPRKSWFDTFSNVCRQEGFFLTPGIA